MADVHDKATRSYNMSRIKSKNTKPEILVRKFLFANGFRYRLNDKKLPGKPDIVQQKYKTVIFVNGCFWHGHTCAKSALPANNMEFWREKITKNRERDTKNQKALRDLGFHVIVIWECELKNRLLREKRLYDLVDEIKSL